MLFFFQGGVAVSELEDHLQPSNNEPYVGQGFVKIQVGLSHNPSPEQEPHFYAKEGSDLVCTSSHSVGLLGL